MLMELETVTNSSFYKSDSAESIAVLLIIIKREFCYRDEKGQRILIQKLYINNNRKMPYLC